MAIQPHLLLRAQARQQVLHILPFSGSEWCIIWDLNHELLGQVSID